MEKSASPFKAAVAAMTESEERDFLDAIGGDMDAKHRWFLRQREKAVAHLAQIDADIAKLFPEP